MKTFVDLETRSELDISSGSHNYSKHPSTRVLCIAISNEDGNVAVYDLMQNPHWPKEWENAVKRGDEIVAHNVAFEYEMFTNNLGHWPQPHPEMWRDTQAKCLCAGFPAKLGAAAKALKLEDLKDEAGAALINFFCKPIAAGGEAGKFREPADHAERWKLMMEYCRQDVVTMMAVDKALPDLSDDELAFWLATWDQNRRGVAIDVDLVRSLSLMVVAGRLAIADRLEYFNFDDLSNHHKVLIHVQDAGLAIDSVAKARVQEALALDIPERARSVLEARQAAGKTSVSKLDSLLLQVGADGRLRHMTRASGTTTGRDSSVGLNIQNLPRGEKMDVVSLIAAAHAGDEAAFAAAAQVKGKPDPLGGVVTCLRGCFFAPPGKVLHQCDWSAVEPRIGAWLVGDRAMQAAFQLIDEQGGVDIYQIEAAVFYGCKPDEIKGERRQFGKVYVLQNQYESGEASIQRAAHDMYGLDLTIEEALICKNKWRTAHPLWVNAWHDLNTGAMTAVRCPKRVFKCGKVAWCFDGQHLKLRLPSSRIVWFPWAEIRDEATPWGQVKPMLSYEFTHPKTKQWCRGTTHGGALFNVVVQGTGACLMRYAARNLRRRGMNAVMRVHDEVVIEGVDSFDAFNTFKATMLEVPPWAEGLRLNGAGFTAKRYKKD